jgi:hypothetical protein
MLDQFGAIRGGALINGRIGLAVAVKIQSQRSAAGAAQGKLGGGVTTGGEKYLPPAAAFLEYGRVGLAIAVEVGGQRPPAG